MGAVLFGLIMRAPNLQENEGVSAALQNRSLTKIRTGLTRSLQHHTDRPIRTKRTKACYKGKTGTHAATRPTHTHRQTDTQHTHTATLKDTHTHTHTHTHTCTLTLTHTHTHDLWNPHTHTHTHAQEHTDKQRTNNEKAHRHTKHKAKRQTLTWRGAEEAKRMPPLGLSML